MSVIVGELHLTIKNKYKQMKTILVEIKKDIALTFLQNLESMKILRVIEDKAIKPRQKLSERFSGCLSKERVEELQKELTQMRNEWERV